MKSDAALADRLDKTLKRTQRYAWRYPEEKREHAATTIEQIAAVVHPARNSPAPNAALLQAVLAADAATTQCRQTDDDCVYIARDVDGDGSVDALLCNLDNERAANCQLWDRSGGTWRAVAHFDFYHGNKAEVVAALRAGEITLKPRRWPDLDAAGLTAVTR